MIKLIWSGQSQPLKTWGEGVFPRKCDQFIWLIKYRYVDNVWIQGGHWVPSWRIPVGPHFSNLHNMKMWLSLEGKKIFLKGKYDSSVFWKGFYISTIIFHVIGTLMIIWQSLVCSTDKIYLCSLLFGNEQKWVTQVKASTKAEKTKGNLQ